MKTYALALLATILSLGLTSCSTVIIIPKTLEPEIVPEKKSGNIAFVNLFDYTLPVNSGEKLMNLYREGVRQFNEGLLILPSGTKLYSFITGDTLKRGTEAGQLTAMLPIDSVKILCARYNSEMLLALDSLNIFLDEEWNTERNDDGSKDRTKQFILYAKFYLSLYSATGDLINRSEVQKRLLYKSKYVASFVISFRKAPSIAGATEEAGSLGFAAGQEYVKKLYPETIDEYRTIYTGKAFAESNALMKTGNWDQAIKILEELAKSPDFNTALKAKQNLSVAKEAAGIKEN
jgi:hypothetical protein